MTSSFDDLVQCLKALPGVGFRSAERMALHLLLDEPAELQQLISSLQNAASHIHACARCGNLAQDNQLCNICVDPKRDAHRICVVERVPDLVALERVGAFRGLYHVLGGRLSPINGVGVDKLRLQQLRTRIQDENIEEVVLALSNDLEGEATCHYMVYELFADFPNLTVSRIAFGVPSGASLTYSDQVTLKSALDGRRTVAR